MSRFVSHPLALSALLTDEAAASEDEHSARIVVASAVTAGVLASPDFAELPPMRVAAGLLRAALGLVAAALAEADATTPPTLPN